MLKRILAALLIGALSLFPDIVSAPEKALAQSSPFASVSAGPTTLSASGALTLGNLGYYSSCAVSVQGTFTATITPQVTQDGTNWITAPGASAIVAPTTTNYAISSFNAFRLNVTWVSGTSVTLSMTCSTASLSAGGTAAVVSVSNTPGVTVQNTPAVVFPSAQPVTVASSVPIVFPSAQPVTIASNAPVVFPSAQPVTIASNAPVTVASSIPTPAPPTVYSTSMPSATPAPIKTAAGVLLGANFTNSNASIEYCGIYNTATITLGSTLPLVYVAVPATSTTPVYVPPTIGVTFSTAIWAYCATTYYGSTASPANTIFLSAFFF